MLGDRETAKALGLTISRSVLVRAAPLPERAADGKGPRIGILTLAVAFPTHTVEAFRQGPWEPGYVEDQNIDLEYRFAQPFHVAEGEIISLIGANGAGKTTTLLTFQVARTLSGGEQQMLVTARSLMSRPRLDEPSMGCPR